MEIKYIRARSHGTLNFLIFKRPVQKIGLAILGWLTDDHLDPSQGGESNEILNSYTPVCTLSCFTTDDLLTYMLQDMCFTSPLQKLLMSYFTLHVSTEQKDTFKKC